MSTRRSAPRALGYSMSRQPVDSRYSAVPAFGDDQPQIELRNLNTRSSLSTVASSSQISHDDDTSAMQSIDINESAFEEKALPNWKPKWIDRGPWCISVLIIIIMIVYIVLYVRGTYKFKDYIWEPSSKIDWIFRFGPVIMASVVYTMVEELHKDLSIISPYLALTESPSSQARNSPAARLTEPTRKEWFRSLPSRKNGWLKFAKLYCTLGLGPLQAGLFSIGSRETGNKPTEFRALGLQELFSAAYESTLSKTTIDALYDGTAVSDFGWISRMQESYSEVGLWPWMATMPFRVASNSETRPLGAEEKWDAQSSVMAPFLRCDQINDFSIAAYNVSVLDQSRSIDHVEMKVSDQNRCSFSVAWNQLSSEREPSDENPLLSDGSFAIWTTACQDNTYVLISGPLAQSPVQEFYANASTPNWGAISCTSYIISITNISFHTESIGQSRPSIDLASFSSMETNLRNGTSAKSFGMVLTDITHPPWDPSFPFSIPMQRTVINSSLLYQVPSLSYSRNFWGSSHNRTMHMKEYIPHTEDELNCSKINGERIWTNSHACKMYLIAADLWGFLASTMAVSVALYVPVDHWRPTTGTVITRQSCWYLSAFALMYTLLLYAAVILFICLERSLAFPFKWKFGKIIRAQSQPTGLHLSPATIAGLAVVFQSTDTRQLCDGIDGMQRKEALDRHRNSLGGTSLILRRWSDSDYGGRAVAKPATQKRRHPTSENATALSSVTVLHHGPASLQHISSIGSDHRAHIRLSDNKQTLQKLRYGSLPIILRIAIPLFFAIIATIIVVFVILIGPINQKKRFSMWKQDALKKNDEGFTHSAIRTQIHKLLFASLPTLFLSLISLWWGEIDKYLRRTQPYVALTKGAEGSKTVLLEYMHTPRLYIPFKALWNRHWKLFYVTLSTIAMRVAVIFAAGIFIMEVGPDRGRKPFTLQQQWRQEIFPENTTQAFTDELQSYALSRAWYGNTEKPGWQTASYRFPSVSLEESDHILELSGIGGSLDCTSAIAEGWKSNDDSSWTARITDGVCEGATWSSACAISESMVFNDTTTQKGQCMAWKYLNGSDCSSLTDEAGRWWILGLSGPLDQVQGGLDETSSLWSLLCTPKFYLNKVHVTARRSMDASGPLLRNPFFISRDEIQASRWRSDTGKSFATYTSEVLNTTFAGKLTALSSTTYLDLLSSMTALSLKNSADDLFRYETLAQGASQTFGDIFNTMAGLDQSGATPGSPGSSFLLEAVQNGAAPPVNAYPLSQVGKLQVRHLYVGLVALFVFGVPMPFLWRSHRRRTPLDISYPANVLSMIYDSSLMNMVAADQSDNLESLKHVKFAIGTFIGLSGNQRMGIDVAEKVQQVEKSDSIRGFVARKWETSLRSLGFGVKDDYEVFTTQSFEDESV